MGLSVSKELLIRAIYSVLKTHENVNLSINSTKRVNINEYGIEIEDIRGNRYLQSWEVIPLEYK